MKPHDEKLQRLFDGELGEAESVTLSAQLTEEDKDKLACLKEVSDLVSGVLLKEAEGVDLWTGIAARLPSETETQPETQQQGAPAVIRPIGSARKRTYSRVSAAVMALSLAASVLFYVRGQKAPSNRCDIESLEVAGLVASVVKVPGDGDDDETTVIWMDHEESDEWESL